MNTLVSLKETHLLITHIYIAIVHLCSGRNDNELETIVLVHQLLFNHMRLNIGISSTKGKFVLSNASKTTK